MNKDKMCFVKELLFITEGVLLEDVKMTKLVLRKSQYANASRQVLVRSQML